MSRYHINVAPIVEIEEDNYDFIGNTHSHASRETLLQNIGSAPAQYDTGHDPSLQYGYQPTMYNGHGYGQHHTSYNDHDYGQQMARSQFDEPWDPMLHQFDPLCRSRRSAAQGSTSIVPPTAVSLHRETYYEVAQQLAPHLATLSAINNPPQRVDKVPIVRFSSSGSETPSTTSSELSKLPCTEPGCDVTFGCSLDQARHVKDHHDLTATEYACYIDGYHSSRLDKIRDHCRNRHKHPKGEEHFIPIINGDWSNFPVVPKPKRRRSSHSASPAG